MDYAATLNYINSFINFEQIPRYNYLSSFKIERMHAFLQELEIVLQVSDIFKDLFLIYLGKDTRLILVF